MPGTDDPLTAFLGTLRQVAGEAAEAIGILSAAGLPERYAVAVVAAAMKEGADPCETARSLVELAGALDTGAGPEADQ